jgi:hypothetical protein
MRGGGELVSITIEATAEHAGFTHTRAKPFDSAFITYAGPWAEARAQWPHPTLDAEDDDGYTFDDYVLAKLLSNAKDAADYQRQQAADAALLGPSFAHLAESCAQTWSGELERSWPVICEVARMLLTGSSVTTASIRMLLDRRAALVAEP